MRQACAQMTQQREQVKVKFIVASRADPRRTHRPSLWGFPTPPPFPETLDLLDELADILKLTID